jgi:hypothetical protein
MIFCGLKITSRHEYVIKIEEDKTRKRKQPEYDICDVLVEIFS